MDQRTVPRVITLLDELKEEIDGAAVLRSYPILKSRLTAKATEAQNVLLGEAPVDARDN